MNLKTIKENSNICSTLLHQQEKPYMFFMGLILQNKILKFTSAVVRESARKTYDKTFCEW